MRKREMFETKFDLFKIYLTLWGAYFLRVWSIALLPTKEGMRAGWLSSWADGAAHLSYMSSFAYRSSFPKQNIIFLGKDFSYPFVADMLGGMLMRLGVPFWISYNLLGFVFSMFLVVMVWKLFDYLFKNSLVSFISSAIFFLGAGLENLGKFFFSEDKSFWNTYDWVDIISAQIMPQRALILGMPLAIFVLLYILKVVKGKNVNKFSLFLLGTLTGLMPIIHPHSLLILFILIFWVFIVDVFKRKKIRAFWWWFGAPAVLIGSWFLFKQTSTFDGSFVKYLPGWLAASKNENLFWFWIKSWGVWPIVVLLGWIKLQRQKKFLFFPLILMFVFLNFYTLQPYDWDNTKIFIWIYLFFSGVAGSFVSSLINKRKFFGGLLLFLMIFSGSIDAFRLVFPQNNPKLVPFTNEELLLAKSIRNETDPNSIFLTSDYHLSIIPTLTGRQILMGYRGWLWTYGIDYGNREKEVEVMYGGGDGGEYLLEKYGVDYVVFDNTLFWGSMNVDEDYFRNNYSLDFESSGYRVYKIN
ncbi:hypothetical protein ACFL1M_01000 [Patescibacteria group bacterium]